MSTNYYLYQKPACPCCGRDFEKLHIGKSSYGWCFLIHVIPEEGINTLDDWRKKWMESGSTIKDENGDIISIEQMEDCITQRRPGHYSREEPMHHSSGYCVSGEGTWDYMEGDFE